MLLLSTSSGLDPIRAKPLNSTCTKNSVVSCAVAVWNCCATARMIQQPALYSSPRSASTVWRPTMS